jgi:hypothetical protein
MRFRSKHGYLWVPQKCPWFTLWEMQNCIFFFSQKKSPEKCLFSKSLCHLRAKTLILSPFEREVKHVFSCFFFPKRFIRKKSEKVLTNPLTFGQTLDAHDQKKRHFFKNKKKKAFHDQNAAENFAFFWKKGFDLG